MTLLGGDIGVIGVVGDDATTIIPQLEGHDIGDSSVGDFRTWRVERDPVGRRC